ncbi:MAG: serine hydrolase, partial [Thermoanaerobaculia bacterium]|nr:serine hydrolase [Thermoanaerobaculia bacterium]
NADLESLRSYYLTRGYLEFRIESTQVAIDPGKEDMTITINISEGNRYVVSSVELQGEYLGKEAEFKSLVALRAGEPLVRDVVVLFSDAEEVGLHGARAFVEQHPWARPVMAVVNFDARGHGGPVLTFQTGENSGAWLQRLIASVPGPVGSSLLDHVYRRLPNRTDFTVFQEAGYAGYNLAFIEGLSSYHGMLDNPGNLDLGSLQHQGAYALGLARGLGGLAAEVPSSADRTYFNVLGGWMVSYPRPLAWLLAAVAVLGYFGVVFFGLRRRVLSGLGLVQGLLSFAGLAVLVPVALTLVWLLVRAAVGIPLLMSSTLGAGRFMIAFALLGLALALALLRLFRRLVPVLDLAVGAAGLWLVLVLLTSGTWLPVEASFLSAGARRRVGARAARGPRRPGGGDARGVRGAREARASDASRPIADIIRSSSSKLPAATPAATPTAKEPPVISPDTRHVVFSWILLALLAVPAVSADGGVDGHWRGSIAVPTGELAIDVDLATTGGALSGDISIPIQGLHDFALADLAVEGSDIRFKLPGIPGEPSFEGTLSEDGSTISGTFRQGGAELGFELTRGDAPAARARAALDGFDAVLEQAVADWNVPGLGIAVVAGGEVVFARGFGQRDLERGLPMTPDTLFAIGSTTKAMTTTVLGMLVDEGKLDWDQPVRRYLPGFRLADEVVGARITTRDLVSHRSGLPRHDLLWYSDRHGTRENVVARLADLELSADLRQKFQYNNLMFMTAGYLAGELTGKSWEETVQERLFSPLGMTRSVFSVDAMQKDADHALPYKENDDKKLERIPFRNIDLIGPAGAVDSSVQEMSRWLLFNLAGGKVGDRQLIQPATLADLQSPQMALPNPPPTEKSIAQRAYGMGWLIAVYRGHKMVEHGGGIDGFNTEILLFPDDGVGVVAFTNRNSELATYASREAADRVLGLAKVEHLADALKRAKEAEAAGRAAAAKKDSVRAASTHPSHPLASYVGAYTHPGYGRLEIAAATGENALEMVYNEIRAPLDHWHYDVWNGAKSAGDPTFEDVKFRFRTSFDGDIDAVEAPFEPTVAPIVFTKVPDARLSDPVFLARFFGVYVGPTGQRATIELAGDALTLHLPGQPLYTLVPEVSGRFAIEGLQGFSVGFDGDLGGKAAKIVFYQPNGVFEFVREK